MNSLRHLLWVEDDADVLLRPLRLILESRGFNVDVALEYSTAKEMLSSKTYDAVLADVILPLSPGPGALDPYLGVTLLSDLRSGRCFEASTGIGTPHDAVFAFLSVVPQLELELVINTGDQPFAYFSKAHLLDPNAMDSMISVLSGESRGREILG